MGWPQITLAVLYGISWLSALANHGKPRANYDVGMSTAAIGLAVWLLWCGGFWGQH